MEEEQFVFRNTRFKINVIDRLNQYTYEIIKLIELFLRITEYVEVTALHTATVSFGI